MTRLCVMTDVTTEDSGNYTCEVRGRKSAVLASVTHYVFVRGMPHHTYTFIVFKQLIFRDKASRPCVRLVFSVEPFTRRGIASLMTAPTTSFSFVVAEKKQAYIVFCV